jgi:SAM-dependent methyltransferase
MEARKLTLLRQILGLTSSYLESKLAWRLRELLSNESSYSYFYCIEEELMACQSVLDLGCGKNSPIKHISLLYSVGVDIFPEYLELSKQNRIHSAYILSNIANIEFKSKSFDAVIALDLIEHLTKDEVHKLIYKMEKWARKKVIILTPNGFLAQHEYDDNPHQEHHSGWHVKDFANLGYSVKGINGLRILRGEQALIRFKPKWFWEPISDYTQKYTYAHPKHAFHLLAVKELY